MNDRERNKTSLPSETSAAAPPSAVTQRINTARYLASALPGRNAKNSTVLCVQVSNWYTRVGDALPRETREAGDATFFPASAGRLASLRRRETRLDETTKLSTRTYRDVDVVLDRWRMGQGASVLAEIHI